DHHHRGRQADLLPLRPAARAQGRRGVHGQRPPRVLPPPAGPAHDQHLLRRGQRDPGGADRGRGARPLRGLVRRRPGRARHRRLRVRRLRGIPDRERQGHEPGPRRHPHRQRARGAAVHRRRGGRPQHRHRLLRQGGPARGGRSGAAARAHPRPHGGRHGRMSELEATARKAVEAALGAGASDAEAWVEEAVTRQIRVYEGNVESLTDAGSRGVGLRVFLDGRSGYAYGTDLTDSGVKELADWTTERKIELAVEIERAARSHKGVSQVEDTVYSDAEGAVAIANSRDFSASYEATSTWAYASAFAGEGAD